MRLFSLMMNILILSGVVWADDFVPFVIPADVHKDSMILIPHEPIVGESDRITVRGNHFYRDGQRFRFWGVNLSFGANLPSQGGSGMKKPVIRSRRRR